MSFNFGPWYMTTSRPSVGLSTGEENFPALCLHEDSIDTCMNMTPARDLTHCGVEGTFVYKTYHREV
jgi:hypothetical protein